MDFKGMIENVADFHQAIGAAVATHPVLLGRDTPKCREIAQTLRSVCETCRANTSCGSDLLPRLAMALEELAEWVEAHVTGDLVAAADAWGDRLYVLLGDAIAAGLPAADIFAEVHRSNMTKVARHADAAGKAQKGRRLCQAATCRPAQRTDHRPQL